MKTTAYTVRWIAEDGSELSYTDIEVLFNLYGRLIYELSAVDHDTQVVTFTVHSVDTVLGDRRKVE